MWSHPTRRSYRAHHRAKRFASWVLRCAWLCVSVQCMCLLVKIPCGYKCPAPKVIGLCKWVWVSRSWHRRHVWPFFEQFRHSTLTPFWWWQHVILLAVTQPLHAPSDVREQAIGRMRHVSQSMISLFSQRISYTDSKTISPNLEKHSTV